MKRARFLAAGALLAAALLPVGAPPLARAAPAAASRPPAPVAAIPVHLLVDLGSGQVLSQRQPDLRFVPASMTKVMTLFVAFEELKQRRLDPGKTFTVTPQIAREWSGRGTSMYLAPGDVVPLGTLMQGIATASANDASALLAHGYAGSFAGWSLLMNARGRELGMTRSRFASPSGWPDGGKTYVTARDLVTLGQALIARHPELYRQYFGRRSMTWNGRALTSHDPVSGIVAGADGMKTGYTREAGYNFLGSAQRGGRRLIMVVAGARSDAERAEASRALLEWGFSAWKTRPLFAKGQFVARARVQGGDHRHVALVSDRAVYATLLRGQSNRISLRLVYDGPLVAPIAKGAQVATLEIRVNDMAPGAVPLYARDSIATAGVMDRIGNGLMGLFE